MMNVISQVIFYYLISLILMIIPCRMLNKTCEESEKNMKMLLQ